MRKMFAFDFHGVLSRNNEKAVQYYINYALEFFDIAARIDLATIILHYGVSFQQYFRMVYPGAEKQLYDELTGFIFERQVLSFDTVRVHILPQCFARFTLEMLRSYGHDLIVISNTPQNVISDFTDAVGLTDCFNEIVGVHENGGISCANNLSNYKARVLMDFAKAGGYEQIIMIGDAKSDILAGKMANAKTYLFCSPLYNEICNMNAKWESIISQTNPDYVIKDLRSLIREI